MGWRIDRFGEQCQAPSRREAAFILTSATVMDSPAMSFLPTMRLLLPGLSGLLPEISRFLESATCVTEVLSGETALPIMVRCMFPPNTQSRHFLRRFRT